MNKTELQKALAKSTGLTNVKAAEAVDALFEIITDELAAHRKVSLTGFGTFLARHRAARKGTSPQTGTVIDIAAKWVPAFKVGATLKGRVAGE